MGMTFIDEKWVWGLTMHSVSCRLEEYLFELKSEVRYDVRSCQYR